MPHLIPMPGMDVKEEDVFLDENEVKTENADPEVLSDGMDISDSDEYDEEEVKISSSPFLTIVFRKISSTAPTTPWKLTKLL